MFKTNWVLAVWLGILVGGSAVAGAAEAPTMSDLARTIQALKTRIRDQERRIAELEDTQSGQARSEQVRKLVDEALGEVGPSDFRLYWDKGMRAKTGDGRLSMKFGGRFYYDWTWVDGDPMEDTALFANIMDGSEVRTARLYWQGEWNKKLAFKWQVDFDENDTEVKDLYVELKKLPVVGNLRMGHFKEPFGLEELTSSKYVTFLERSLPVDEFAPSRNSGFMIHNHALDKRMTWAAGIFAATGTMDDDGDALGQKGHRSDGNYTFTTRLTGLPMYQDNGRQLLHLGAAYSYRSRDDGFRTDHDEHPEAHIVPDLIDTPNFGDIDGWHLLGGEVALILGQLHVSGEYMASMPRLGDHDVVVPAGADDDPCFDGWYVQVGYFLTGEVRNYKTSSGTFDRTRPLKNWDEGGPGAWEVALRYSNTDFNSGGIVGGREENYTVGLNWYLNENVRLMWNYVHADVEDVLGNAGVDENIDIFLMRFQVDF